MISLLPLGGGGQARLRRRDMLRLSGLGALGWALPLHNASGGELTGHAARARHCIYIFLCGGPSQLEMWDPKPAAPAEIRGPFQAITTNVPGIRIGELLPQTARHADKFAILRSLHHNTTSHDVGIMYTLLADSNPPTQRAYPPTRDDHPGMGAILSSLLGDTAELPAWVTVPRPFTTGARFYKGQSAGFLGPTHDPFLMDEEKRDSLADKDFRLDALRALQGWDARRLVRRKALLKSLQKDSHHVPRSAAAQQFQRYHERAFSMLSSDGARRAFDVSREPEKVRDRYGRNEYGQSFLLARRLVQYGVRMVNVFWTYYGADGCQFNLWDNHGSDKKVCGGFNKGMDMLTADYCCPSFDRAFSALLEDLDQRGLLDETLVVVVGEFGRTPKINKNSGRDHWGACYSAVLAGGGIRGGQVYGASDKHAAYVQNAPLRPEDLGATILHAFGLPPETPVYDPARRPVHSSKGQPLTALF